MRRDVCVVIPTIPPRQQLLRRAIQSAQEQNEAVTGYSIAVDTGHLGGWENRNRAIRGVDARACEWIALLDDDDELLPVHTRFLLDRCEQFGLDMAWGWFIVNGGADPFPGYRGRQYDPAEPHIFPITVLVRTALLQSAVQDMGGFQPDPGGEGNWMIQDRPVWDYVAKEGKIRAFPDSTWIWHHHRLGHTSGVPTRW
jgi:glycosyltransferase involved in cell wall biosynthesis